MWKTVRIFISSTFRDMHAERDFLVRVVFPELRERCAKRNLHLIDVDLRWGVTEEEAKQGKVIEICFDEIERCRPFFIGLLGERYGWMSEKFEVSDDEMFEWLKKYQGHSVTALEIYYGVLRDEEMKTRAFFYFRDAEFQTDVPAENRADFLPESDDAAQKLNDLKQEIKAKNYPVFENYPCRFDGIDESGRVKLAGLEEFGKRVLEDLWTAICLEHPEDEMPPDDLAIERSFHETFIENRTTRFIGRRDVLDKLHEFADGEEENSLVVTGAAGCGKSTVLAKFAKEYAVKHAEDFVLTHFIGVSPGSTDVRRTLLRLCRELKRKFEIQEEIPTDYYELRQAFVIFLEQAAESGKVLLILDALNQLDAQHFARQLDWLLSPLPKGVKIIVSTLEGDCLDALRRRNPQPREVLIGSLTEAERREIVTKTLETYRKTLDENQMRRLLRKKESDNPLFLNVACEELRVYGDFDTVSVKLNSLAEQVETLFGQVLERVEHDHGKDLVTDALVLLECSRYGLLESEMLELLARNGEKQLPQAVWARFYRSLNFYLRPSGNNENQSGEGLLDFFHRQLSKAVRQKYLLDKEIEIATHQRLARYFQLKADASNDKSWTGNYPRGLSELAHHQLAGKLYEDLFQTARDETFLQAQANAFIEEPAVQSDTLQKALTGSAQTDDAAKMAEFMFRHYHQVTKLTNESPLRVFQKTGNLERARNLCEVWFRKDKEYGILQFLWLIWELKQQGRLGEAGNLLRSFQWRINEFPKLRTYEMQELAAIALTQLFELDYESFNIIQNRLLDNDGKLIFCNILFFPIPQEAKFNTAIEFAEQIGDARVKADVYSRIDKARNELEMSVWHINDEKLESIITNFMRASCDKACQVTENTDDDYWRAKTYIAIAKTQLTAGFEIRAKKNFGKAMKIYEQKDDDDEGRAKIAIAQAEVGYFDEALYLAKQINDCEDYPLKAETFVTIVEEQAIKSNINDALKIAKRIEFGFDTLAFAKIVKALSKENRISEALMVIELIHDKPHKDEAYFAIVKAQAAAGKINDSLITAKKISGKSIVDQGYVEIVKAQAMKGNIIEAFNTVKMIDNNLVKSDGYSKIAQALALVGLIENAIEITEKINDGYDKIDSYIATAKAQALAGLDTEAASFRQSLEGVAQFTRGKLKEITYSKIAETQAIIGYDREALKTVEVITTDYGKAEAYTSIAQAQALAERNDEAIKTTQEILFNRNEYLPQVAKAFSEKQNKSGFKKLLLPSSYYLDACYEMSGLLAQLYPEQANNIAQIVDGES